MLTTGRGSSYLTNKVGDFWLEYRQARSVAWWTMRCSRWFHGRRNNDLVVLSIVYDFDLFSKVLLTHRACVLGSNRSVFNSGLLWGILSSFNNKSRLLGVLWRACSCCGNYTLDISVGCGLNLIDVRLNVSLNLDADRHSHNKGYNESQSNNSQRVPLFAWFLTCPGYFYRLFRQFDPQLTGFLRDRLNFSLLERLESLLLNINGGRFFTESGQCFIGLIELTPHVFCTFLIDDRQK